MSLGDGQAEVVPLTDGARVLQQRFVVLAEDGLPVVAGDVVPGDAVVVDAVQQAEAGLGGLVDGELGVVRLRLLEVAGLRPRLLRPACRCAARTVSEVTGKWPGKHCQRWYYMWGGGGAWQINDENYTH